MYDIIVKQNIIYDIIYDNIDIVIFGQYHVAQERLKRPSYISIRYHNYLYDIMYDIVDDIDIFSMMPYMILGNA